MSGRGGVFGLWLCASGVLLALLLLGLSPMPDTSMAASDGSSSSESSSSSQADDDSTDGSDTDEPTDEETTEPESCDSRQAVVDFLGEQGFKRSDYTFKVRWKDLPDNNTSGRFSQPLRSIGDIATLRDTTSRKATAFRQLLGEGVTTTDYVAIQLRGPFEYSGNWYLDGDQVVEGGTIYGLGGDVWWLHVSPRDCTVDPKVSLRALCGNVGFTALVPWDAREE